MISAEELWNASLAVKAELGGSYLSTEVRVEVEVSITNWLGGTDTATASVEILKGEVLLPQIMATSPLEVRKNISDEVSFTIETKGAASASACAGMNQTSTGSQKVVVTWEYKASAMANWTTLELAQVANPALKDTSPQPNVVRFAPFTFSPLSQHFLRAIAAYSDTPSTVQKPLVSFSLEIAQLPPPVAIISGPQEVSGLCEFSLDASSSRDPSVNSGETANLSYSWACSPGAVGGPSCAALTNFAAINASRTDGSGAAGPLFRVRGGQLLNGTYVFSLTVSRIDNGTSIAAGVASVSLQVREDALPPITVFTTWESMDRVSVRSTQKLLAVIQSSPECPVPESWAWRWLLYDEAVPSTMVSLLVTHLELADADGILRISAPELQGQNLVPGHHYACALLRANSAEDLSQLESGLPTVWEQTVTEIPGALAARSVSFIADGNPCCGTMAITPLVGETLKTSFALTTSGWYDEDTPSLSYAFYRFPLVGATLAHENSSLLVTPAFTPPTIEWYNATSSHYWPKLGGLALRTWAPAQETVGLLMPAGAYFLVARARDVLGGEGTILVLGPLVSELTKNITQADAASALQSTLASNDADLILNTVDTVSTASAGSNDTTTKQAVVNLLLDTLATAVTIFEPSTEGMQKMGQVISSTVTGGKGAMNTTALSQASSLVSKCVDAALTGAVGGITKEAGDAMLGSITAITSSLIATQNVPVGGASQNQSSQVQAAEVSKEVAAIASKVGQAAMEKVEVGGTQELSSLNSDNTGLLMSLAKLDTTGLDTVTVAELTVAAELLSPGVGSQRRLTGDCGSSSVLVTEWRGSNPHRFAPSGVGWNDDVAESATVLDVELRRCGQIVNVDSSSTPLRIELTIQAASAPAGFHLVPHCATFEETQEAWSVEGLSATVSADGKVSCLAERGGDSSYVAFYKVTVDPTTTTSTSTGTTSTGTTNTGTASTGTTSTGTSTSTQASSTTNTSATTAEVVEMEDDDSESSLAKRRFGHLGAGLLALVFELSRSYLMPHRG